MTFFVTVSHVPEVVILIKTFFIESESVKNLEYIFETIILGKTLNLKELWQSQNTLISLVWDVKLTV